MNTSIQLTINEVLAMSLDVSCYIYDQTRKRRIPIEQPSEPNAVAATISSPPPSLDQNTQKGIMLILLHELKSSSMAN